MLSLDFSEEAAIKARRWRTRLALGLSLMATMLAVTGLSSSLLERASFGKSHTGGPIHHRVMSLLPKDQGKKWIVVTSSKYPRQENIQVSD